MLWQDIPLSLNQHTEKVELMDLKQWLPYRDVKNCVLFPKLSFSNDPLLHED